MLLHSRGRETIPEPRSVPRHLAILPQPVLKSIEDYNNLIKAGPLKMHKLQEERFRLLHQQKSPGKVCLSEREYGMDCGRRK